MNFVNTQWNLPKQLDTYPDPMTGQPFLKVPSTSTSETQPFVDSLTKIPKTGLHNPFKNPSRYLKYGDVSFRAAEQLRIPEVLSFFAECIQRVAPKSTFQAEAEVKVCEKFLENFSGDQVRYLARSFGVPGDHYGQSSHGYRWPYGPVVIICPFNFPLEIPLLQMMGALYMGNKVLLKADSRVSLVMEQCIRMLHHCGMPLEDVDFINCNGDVMHDLLMRAEPRMTQFTGSSRVAEILAKDLSGRMKIEDAGFDWKILGPDVSNMDFVAYTCDQDAYAYSGQKCSAQSMLFAHSNWVDHGLFEKLKALAARRTISDFTIGPVLTVTNDKFEAHQARLLDIPGTRILFGGRALSHTQKHTIPSVYGSWEPTAVFVPLSQMLLPQNFEVCTTEIFGPFQVVTSYTDEELPLVLQACERMSHHLTAAIVSEDISFQTRVCASTVNGTTYCGIQARTTGAPQNHWFGPAGDPRGAGIGTREAIQLVWSCHREIVYDQGPVPENWTIPAAT